MSRLRLVIDLARPYRGRLLLAVVLTLVSTAFSLTPPLVMRYLLDNVVSKSQWQHLAPVIAIFAALPLWSTLLSVMNRFVITAVGQRLIVDIRTALYRHVLNLSLRFHGRVGSGLIMNRMMTDVGVVQSSITAETIGVISSALSLVFCVGIVFHFSWKLALILIVILVLYTFNYHKFAARIHHANLELRELMDQVTGRLQERLAGVRLVKTYCRERDETAEFLGSTDRALQFGMRSAMLNVSLSSTARIIGGIGSTVVYCLAAYYVLRGQISYGTMQAIDNYLWQAIWPAINLTSVAGTLTQAAVSLDRIAEISHQAIEVQERPGAIDLEECTGDLRLEDVFFEYEADKPLLTGLNLHLPAGKMTALVGHTGCGKTTVTSLLMRLWDVQDGRVVIDGHDVRDLTLRTLRHHTGVVPQEPVIFESTVHDNIAYAMPEATPEQVEEAARAAQIHDYIMTLPDGYQTWLGKEGSKVSVGEKQRIAIARAILRKPAVLILDEATSSLDSESEAALQQAMRVVLHGRTSVVVAHRLSTIVEADQIVAMDQGKVVELGTHDELMQLEGGYYRKLYEELKGEHEQEVAP
ncbi:MAG: ABC transporter ATP-binding protein [Armatimonadota bacterium]